MRAGRDFSRPGMCYSINTISNKTEDVIQILCSNQPRLPHLGVNHVCSINVVGFCGVMLVRDMY